VLAPNAVKQAQTLDEFWKVLDPQPLQAGPELEAFYRDDLNKVRGTGASKQLQRELTLRHGENQKFRCLVYGNQGCGKSTEINKILDEERAHFCAIRLSVAQELNPASFQVFDILLLILFRVVEEVRTLQNREWLPSLKVPKSLWLEVVEYLNWVGSGKQTVKKEFQAKAVVGSLNAARGEIQYAAGRSNDVVEYRLSRLSFLADRVNALLDAANAYLADKHGNREWIVVVEDLDKQSVSAKAIREILIDHAQLLGALRIHLVVNVPAWMVWSPDATRLPFSPNHFQIPDVPIYESSHGPCDKGRKALWSVLQARVNVESLFAKGQVERCIVASGGNIRDLFALAIKASTLASIRDRKKIETSDVDLAIAELRSRYETALGDNPFEGNPIPHVEKMNRLIAVFNQQAELSSRHDRNLNVLLKAGAVLRFNGDNGEDGRYGVHPLVVDLLRKYKLLTGDKILGGSI
jgi:hypothetical protein